MPELNAALEHFRNEVFIPYGLPKRQQKSMFTLKYAQQLENEPIVVDLNKDEKYTLTPKKRHELPPKKQAMDVIAMMVKSKDYSNLFAFTSGLKMAGYVVTTDRWQSIIRHAGVTKKLPTILQCAIEGKRTGLTLGDKNVARALFYEFHTVATRARPGSDIAVQILQLAHKALGLMNDPLHSANDVQNDPKHQPFVIGTLLELSAICAENCTPTSSDKLASQAKESLIRDYAQKLDASWSRLNSKDASTEYEKLDILRENLAVYNGMRLSLKFPKALEGTGSFQSRMDELKPMLIKQLQGVKNRQIGDDRVAKQLLNGEI